MPLLGSIHLWRPHWGGRVRLRWTGWGGQPSCERQHRKLKLESTDVVLSPCHAKKLMSFYQTFVFERSENGNFAGDLN